MAFGTAMKARPQFATCIKKCQRQQSLCRERHFELHRNQLEPGALEARRPKEREPTTTRAAESVPSAGELPKRTATRAAELDPAPEPKSEPAAADPPATAPPPAAEPEKVPAPEAPSESSSEEPQASQPPPEKPPPPKPKEKKRPLDEWDPEAL